MTSFRPVVIRMGARLAALSAVSIAVSAANAAALPKPVCRQTPDYLVISRGRDGETGSDILVRLQSKTTKSKSCAFSIKPRDFVVGKGESADYLAMHGRYLALDAGTGPDRRLLVFVVEARKKTLDVDYVDGDIAATSPAGFTYWSIDPKPIDPGICPAAWRNDHKDAKAAHATHQIVFGFADGVARKTGKVGCTQTQADM